ncbi:MAG TPA: hypothetical protein VK933_13295 [Longimicrobiales bacterium]|nr:hypothetical protein [Longimicrobiales bacterium]
MMWSVLKRAALCGAALVLLAGARTTARAQTPDSARVRGRIVLIAGADLHLELLSRVPLQPGDTLIVQRGGVERGRLHVLAADSTRAVVGFVAAPFALTRGEVLDAELRGVPRTVIDAGAAGVSAAVVPAPPTAAAAEPGPTRSGPRAAGYIATETRWVQQSGSGTSDSYAVPAATLSLRLTALPNRTNVHVFGHIEHYGTAHAPVGSAATELRLYTARLETAAGPLRVGLGRLTSQHDAASGAWDGISISAGSAFSVAAEGGYEPERPGAAPATRFPRVGLSAQAVTHAGGMRYRGSVGALHYLRDAPGNHGSSALFTRQSVSAGRLSLSGDARVEKSDSGPVALRWGGAYVSARTAGGAGVHAGFRRYSPLLPASDTVSFAPRNRLEAGGHVPFGQVALTLNASASPEAEERARSVSAHLAVQRLPGDLRLDLDAGMWEYGVIRSTTAGAALDRMSGRVYTRAGYRLERSGGRSALYVHELEGDISLGFARASSIGLWVTHSAAGEATGTRAQLRLTWGF